jgi:hypothetical protein
VPLDVPADREAAALASLEASGIGAIGWSNAVVEVSAFSGVETVALAALGDRLTDQDPRWDPWLRSLPAQFHPTAAVARIWVSASDRGPAAARVGASGAVPGKVSPAAVTGWGLFGFSLFYLVLQAATLGLSRRVPWTLGSWAVTGGVAALAVLGLVSALASTPSAPAAKLPPGVTWARHRWFQEAWAEGATWDDWKPGKAWSYPSYERKDGRLTETSVPLAVPDQAWAQAGFEGLDPHHAARIFGPENP